MQLSAKSRAVSTKGLIKKIRREGNIPGVLYAPNQTAETIEVNGSQFSSILRNLKKGHLGTTIFELDVDGKKKKVIIKDIQYSIDYKIIHLDFFELQKDIPVKVRVPIECIGVADCVGMKLGGFLRQVIRKVKVQCLPDNIPEQFELDIRDLQVKDSKRLSDIAIPKEVRLLDPAKEVAVVIAKR